MMRGMRTTITLEPDLAARLRTLAHERGVPFKQVVNETLRRGLSSERQPPRPFHVDARPMHLRPGVDLTHALALAGELEDAEIMRKLELRK